MLWEFDVVHSSKNKPQWLEYLKLVFLEIQNVTIQSVLLNLVTNNLNVHSLMHALTLGLQRS